MIGGVGEGLRFADINPAVVGPIPRSPPKSLGFALGESSGASVDALGAAGAGDGVEDGIRATDGMETGVTVAKSQSPPPPCWLAAKVE